MEVRQKKLAKAKTENLAMKKFRNSEEQNVEKNPDRTTTLIIL